ncbi:hypothetical protein ASE86_01790 [Sphingomonas sp. Leaf33]|uniref:helix-turn-helix domain-containing protein n=1 Tax=Sphingomonas sp. Leaf33 TaxID=1736215 RepID=UPI0006F26787|nr:helix-turn-helix transcriptional regulator [Sphingomonas sp. Leaf33]KQN25025.1 hypothetical protein ASE86_01790 [Sphingomonas sp. Leaf33]
MSADDAQRLTDRQRDCLRLVGQGLSSKEIAVALGISHHTVDLHLKRAIRAMGTVSRRDAARRLEAIDSAFVPDPPAVTTPSPAAVPAEHTQPLDTQPRGIAGPPGIAAISVPAGHDLRLRWRVPFLRQGRQYNDLEPVARLVWIVALAVAMLLAAANFLTGLSVLHDLIT